MGDIDGDEEVAEGIGNLFALRVGAVEHLEKGALLEGGGEDFDDGGIPVALVAGEVFAGPAEGQQRGGARDEIGEHLLGVGLGRAVGGDDPARGHGLVQLGVDFDLAALDDGGGAIEEKREFLVGGHGERERVGAEHVLDAEGGRDGGAGVGAADADHAGFDGHEGIVAGDAEVGGVADGDHAQTVFLGLADGEGHGLVRDDVAHAVAAVEHGGRGGILDDADAGLGELDALPDAVVVDGLEARDAVGVEAELVRGDENVGGDGGVGFRRAEADKHVAHEAFHDGEGNPDRAFFDVHERVSLSGLKYAGAARTGKGIHGMGAKIVPKRICAGAEDLACWLA